MVMNVEIVLFWLFVIFSIHKYYGNAYFRFLPYIVVFLFMAIRYDYGDGSAYREMFYVFNLSAQEMKSIEYTYSDIEPLYVTLNRLLPSFQAVVIITSAFYVTAFCFLISKILTYKQRALAILVWVLHPYILMVDMSTIRQGIAISIIIVGVYVANKRKPVWLIPFCLFATLFHKSAIVCVFACFLFEKRPFSFKTKLVTFLVPVIFLMFSDKLLALIRLFLSVFNLDTANYLFYLNNGNKNGIIAVGVSLIMMLFFMVFGDSVDNQNAVYVKLSIWAVTLEALQGAMQQFGRVSMYFLPFFVISLPLILKQGSPIRIHLLNRIIIVSQKYLMLVEVCFLFVFIWKFRGFMTPQYAYTTILTS